MIPRSFFQRDPLLCARELIGCELLWHGCSGVIVETEAYAAENDAACHTFLRTAARQFIAEKAPGTAYVYLNYGIHWMLNVLTKEGPQAGFVLIRALEPRAGLPLMQARRGVTGLRQLCSGPGKLGQALALSGADHGRDLCGEPEIGFREGPKVPVVEDVRVGITRAAEFPWRFLLEGSAFVSVPLGRVRAMPPPKPRVVRPKAIKPSRLG